MADTDVTDLPTRRDLVQKTVERLTVDLTPEELRDVVDWIDLWLYGRGTSR